jgi:hypothetical protein
LYHQGPTAAARVPGINDELDGEDILPGFKMPVKTLF